MPNADKAFIQAYNAELAVDAAHQVIVAATVVQASNDKEQPIPMVEATIDNCGEVPAMFSGDAGFWSGANVETLEWYEINAVVAPEKIRHREWHEANGAARPDAEEPHAQRADAAEAADEARARGVRQAKDHGRTRVRSAKDGPRAHTVPLARTREGWGRVPARFDRSQPLEAVPVGEVPDELPGPQRESSPAVRSSRLKACTHGS